MITDRNRVREVAGAASGCLQSDVLHRDLPFRSGPKVMVLPLDLFYARRLNTRPVGTLGKKYVDFGGMFTPAAAISRTCSTGVGRNRKAASKSPPSISST